MSEGFDLEVLLQRLREPAKKHKRLERIGKFLEKLTEPDDVIELRILGPRTLSGLYDNREALLSDILKMDEAQAGGVYWTPQKLKSELGDKAANRLSHAGRGTLTSDKDVEGYRYLLVDFDPERETKTSSSDDELQQTLEVARNFVRVVTAEGWPTPTAWACSGNGVHLYFPVNLPVENKELLNSTLKAIGKRFDTATVKSDSTVSNPSRIFRAYGTTNRKGEPTEERPHRQACLLPTEWLEVTPSDSELLTEDQLKLFVSEHGSVPKKKKSKSPKGTAKFSLQGSEAEEWAKLIEQEGRCQVSAPTPFQGGRKWVLTGCPLDSSHEQDNAAVLIEHADGGLSFTCHHSRCQGKTMADLRRYFEQVFEARGQSKPEVLSLSEWEDPIPLDAWHTPEWPKGLLPDTLEAYTDAIAEMNQTPPAQSKMMSIPVLSACVQERYQVDIRGRIENLATYVAAVMSTGERKSADLKRLRGPLAEFEAISHKLAQEKRRDNNFARELLAERAEKLKKDALKTGSEEDEKAYFEARKCLEELSQVVAKRLLAQDITAEKLATLMADMGECITLLSAEGGPLENVKSKYSSLARLATIFLEAFSGDEIFVDRKSQSEPIRLRNPSLSMGIMTQPSHLASILADRDFSGRGLLERFLWCAPRERIGHRRPGVSIPLQTAEAYDSTMTRLLPRPGFRVPSADPVERETLVITGAGLDALNAFEFDRLEPRLKKNGDLRDVKGWATRLPTAVCKLAGLWHLYDAAEREAEVPLLIDSKWVVRAIQWMEQFAIPMGLKTFGLMGADPGLGIAQRIIDTVKEKGYHEFRKAEFKQKHFRSVPAETVDHGYKVLQEYHYLRARKQPGSGRHAVVFEVNPKALIEPEEEVKRKVEEGVNRVEEGSACPTDSPKTGASYTSSTYPLKSNLDPSSSSFLPYNQDDSDIDTTTSGIMYRKYRKGSEQSSDGSKELAEIPFEEMFQ